MLDVLISLLAVQNLIFSEPALADLSSPPPLPEKIAAYPEKTGQSLGPILGAKSILSLDLDTGKFLFDRNSTDRLPMASLAKLMTALIILENHSLDEIVTVDIRATRVEPAKIFLLANEKITVRELIKSLIIKSANDSALALAYYDSPELETFIEKMNARALELGMTDTNFRNPIGFDDPDQYSSVSDLSILARTVYRQPVIRQAATITKTTLSSVNEKQIHEVEATNQLLNSYLKVFGLKTGTTDLAGQCLITIVESPDGHKIMNIMLNSPSRYDESKILSQWVFDNYRWL